MSLARRAVERWTWTVGRPSRWSSLKRWQRRAVKTVIAVVALIFVSSVLYHAVMVGYEGRSQSYGHSAQVVIETYTGTGYGSDSPWESPVANAFVALMDLSTFLLLFIVVPYVFRPVLEEALSPAVPTETEKSGHVVVCGLEQQGERLVDEFEARGVNYVVVAETEEATLELREEGVSAIYGDPTSVRTLRRARVADADSVIVDTADRRSASAVLAIRELDETVRTLVLVEDLQYERHLRYAGADRVLTPRHLVGRRIAERISTEISPIRSDSVALGEGLSVLELSVFEESPICDNTVEAIESTSGESVSVVGLWQDGSFVGTPAEETVIDERTVVLVVGAEEELRELESETYRGREVEPTVVVAGHGIVGSTVRRELRRSTAECTIVDIEPGDAVDVVGDATEEETLREAGIEDATIFVVAIADDDQAMLSVLVATEIGEELDTIVRANRVENETKIRRAGADYVLSLPEISGRVLAQEVLHEQILSYERQLKIVRIDAEPYAGDRLEDTEIAETDCSVVAVERGGELTTDLPPSFEFRGEDWILVAGNDEEIDRITG